MDTGVLIVHSFLLLFPFTHTRRVYKYKYDFFFFSFFAGSIDGCDKQTGGSAFHSPLRRKTEKKTPHE